MPSITSIWIPDSVKTLPSEVFSDCSALTELCIPEEGLGYTLDGKLLYSNGKTQLVLCMRDAEGIMDIADGTTAISSHAFSGCHGITQITFPETMRYIMEGAFKNCTGLVSIRLPHSVSVITSLVFSGCSNLTDIYYDGTEQEWSRMTSRFDLGIDEERTTVHTMN